jgi:hypothetical protein
MGRPVFLAGRDNVKRQQSCPQVVLNGATRCPPTCRQVEDNRTRCAHSKFVEPDPSLPLATFWIRRNTPERFVDWALSTNSGNPAPRKPLEKWLQHGNARREAGGDEPPARIAGIEPLRPPKQTLGLPSGSLRRFQFMQGGSTPWRNWIDRELAAIDCCAGVLADRAEF